MKLQFLSMILCSAFFAVACTAQDDTKTTMATSDKAPEQPTEKVEKTDEEWKKLLTDEQYRVARTAGTERAFGKIYDEYKAQGPGTYYCIGCGAELFRSNTKIKKANSGWPSM